jgi:hypothetical protein
MLGKNRRKNQHGKSGDLEVIGNVWNFDYQPASAKRFLAVIPRKVGSDLAFTTFPDKIDPQAAAEALRCRSILLPRVPSLPRTLT